MTKRIVAMLLAFLLLAFLLLAGCSQGSDTRGTTFTVVPAAAYSPLPKQMIIAVNRDAPLLLQNALDDFCEQIQLLSGGNLVATVQITATALEDFRRGKAQMAMLLPAESANISPQFAVCAEPFRYRSYEQLSMACNSGAVTEALESSNRTLDMRILAGYYTGSTLLATRLFLAGKKAYVPSDGSDRPIALVSNSVTGRGLAWLDFEVRDEANLDTRVELLANGTVQVIELGYDEVAASGLAGQEFHFVLSQNNSAPLWLIVSQQAMDALLPAESAAVEEAAARMGGKIDKLYADRENEAIRLLRESGSEVITDFTGNRAKITNGSASTDTDAAVTRFRALLDSVG